MFIKIIITILLAILSGILGRLGGRAKDGSWYDFLSDSKARDVGCSIVSLAVFCLWFGFEWKFWWVYLITFGLHWGALSLYWDRLFGYDNFWFSGFVVGLALIPLVIVYKLYLLWIIRSILLAIIWGLLNKFLPSKVLIWRRDIAEEFLRYFITNLYGGK